jgi:hypothetical protein
MPYYNYNNAIIYTAGLSAIDLSSTSSAFFPCGATVSISGTNMAS